MPASAAACRAYRARLRRRVAKVLGPKRGPCPVCGTVRPLQLAHRHPTGLSGPSRGVTHRLLDALRHPEAYCRVCQPCHRQLDHSVIARFPPPRLGGVVRRRLEADPVALMEHTCGN